MIVLSVVLNPLRLLLDLSLYPSSSYGHSLMFSIYSDLIQFLQNDLAMSASAIDFALKRSGDFEPLPMILWQYGLVSLEQLDRIYDWLDSAR